MGNPLAPQLFSDSHLSEADADFVKRGLEALPKRYLDFAALHHFGEDEFKWDNGEATATTPASALNLILYMDWFLFIIFGYFTLINYSHFHAAKSWADYSNYTLTGV